jgi:hypothetical protein
LNPNRRIMTFTLRCTLCTLLIALPGSAQAAPATASQSVTGKRDGQRDFDFNLGTWKTNVKRLRNPLTGSRDWIELSGTVNVRKIWDGRAQMDEVELDGPDGHFQIMTLFLYNPESRQWSETFANSNAGTLSVPMIGEFKNGRGEFYSQESFNGRSILARQIWSDIKPNSHQLEQAFSDDGGKTWEANYIATLTRANQP